MRTNGRRLERSTGGWRMFGLKVHARGVALNADLEMHFVPSGYVGLCRLAGGEVNICGLFRSSSTVPDLARSWRTWLGGPDDSVLHSRLAAADLDESSFCSVAGLCLSPLRAVEPTECAVGDALAMIPPFTGNGMSMAFESAELAMEPLARFSRGELTWMGARTAIAQNQSHLVTTDSVAQVLSPSQVRSFMDCQVRWWFRYVLKLRATNYLTHLDSRCKMDLWKRKNSTLIAV